MRYFAYRDRTPSSIPDYFVRAQVDCTGSNVAVIVELLDKDGKMIAASPEPRMVRGIYRKLVIDALEGKSYERADPPELNFRRPAQPTGGEAQSPTSQPSSRPYSAPAAPTPETRS